MADSEDSTQEPGPPARTSLGRLVPLSLLAAAAITALVTILRRVLRGSRFQYYDYWAMLSSSVSTDGSFNWGNLLLLQNEHPVASARLLYFVNAHLFDGSNRSLGLIVVVLVVGQVLLLVSALRMLGTHRSILLSAFAIALLFSPAGIHNFQMSMSGAAWLSANLLALLAIRLVLADRVTPATLAGLSASASYGTGLMVWPALVLILLLAGRRSVPRLLPLLAGWVVSWITYLFLYDRPAGHGGFGLDLGGIGFRSLSVLGSSLSTDASTSALIGAAGVGVLTWLLVGSDPAQIATSKAGLAVCVYAIGAAALIGFSRSEFGVGVGVSSRYVSISALFLVGLFAAAIVLSDRLLPVAVAVALAAAVGGQSTLATYSQLQAESDEAAIAVRIGSGEQYFPSFDVRALPVVRAMEHYPLGGSFDLACGLLGETIDSADFAEGGVVGDVRFADQQRDPALVRGEGTLTQVSTEAECVLAVAAGEVVGAGALGFRPAAGSEREGNVGFAVLVPLAYPDAVVVVVGADGSLYEIGGSLRPPTQG